MTTGKHIRQLAIAAAASIFAACSSSSSTELFGVEGAVQDLTADPDGNTTVLTMESAPAYMTVANVVADGGQAAQAVSVAGTKVTVTWDARVTPSHRVRVTGVSGVENSWRTVTSSDASAPTFTITDAVQDTSDAALGGDTVEVTFSGPRVVEEMAESAANWDLEVNGQSMDMTGASFDLDPATQVMSITLDASANLHSSFSLSAMGLMSVADTNVDSTPVSGSATGDSSAPALVSVEQVLSQDAYGRVVDLTFNEPMDPVFAAIPGRFSLDDHSDSIGTTLVLSVQQPTDSTLRLTFSRPVAPGMDQISHSGLMDAHGNVYGANSEVIANTAPEPNGFAVVTASTVEGGSDTVVIMTDQAFDPDFAEDPARWSMTIAGSGIVMADQTLAYDYQTRTMTITLESEMRNGDAVSVDANGQVDVDGEAFTASAVATAGGDDSAPTFISGVQNRNVDPSGYTLDLTFSEALLVAEAEEMANYTFNPSATIASATVVGAGNMVRVVTTDRIMTPGDVTITISGDLEDLAGNTMSGPSGPNGVTSSDTTAPAPSVVSASAIEGADNDHLIVTFNDQMVESEVESLGNWAFESPVGMSFDLAGASVDYNPASRSAIVTLDAGGQCLKYYDDLQVSFISMRDIGGNFVDPGAISGAISAESNLPSVHTVWRQDAPNDGTLELRFSEPCDNLDDLYDPSTNGDGTRFTLRNSAGTLRGYPTSATILAGGLGVSLNYGFTISLSDRLDVIGAEDQAGNVMFPSMDTPIAGEDGGAPTQSGLTSITAVSGENNDTIVITFSEDMSPWGICDPDQYSVQTNPGGLAVSFGTSDIEWDGAQTVTITLGGPFGESFNAQTNYDVTLNVDASRPLRSRQGVSIGAPDTQTVSVSGDISNGPTQSGSVAHTDTNDPQSLIVIFDEAVDQAAAEVATNFDYDGGNFASSVTLLSPRAVRATFGVSVSPGANLVVAQASTDDLAGNDAGGPITLACAADGSAPLLVSAVGTIGAGCGGDTVTICFNETLDMASALDASNYSVTNGSAVAISGAVLSWDSAGECVTIAFPQGTELDGTQALSVTISGVADAAGNVMPSPVTLAGTVGGDSTPPSIDAAFANYRESLLGNVIDVRFDEDVDPAFAGEVTNWATSGLALPAAVEVLGPNHVRLTLDWALASGETIMLDPGLEDLARNSAAGLSFEPIDPAD